MHDGSATSLGTLGLAPGSAGSGVDADTAIVQGKLDNGMDVVVIPDHRAPICAYGVVPQRLG